MAEDQRMAKKKADGSSTAMRTCERPWTWWRPIVRSGRCRRSPGRSGNTSTARWNRR